MIYNYPKSFLNTWRKVKAATKVPSPQARAWYSVGVRTTEGSQDLLALRKGVLGLTPLKHTALEMRDGKAQDISQPNKKDHFPGFFHPSVSNCSRDAFFYLLSWESICWCNESHSYANFLLAQPKFVFPLSHSITPKHHCQNILLLEMI